MLTETSHTSWRWRLAQSLSHLFLEDHAVSRPEKHCSLWHPSDVLSTDACRRTYISSNNPTRNTAALSMNNRSASEDEKGRGGEIVTIALVPAGGYFSDQATLQSLLASYI